MKKDDLTQIKHIGARRMKLLHDSGITTIKQLYETPLKKLEQIDNIGKHYAERIKNSVIEVYDEALMQAGKKKKKNKFDQDIKHLIQILKKRLKQSNENLKPLGKKKYLLPYIEFKNSSQKLKTRLKALDAKKSDLPKKVKKKIIKNAAALNSTLKTAGKKPKKKNFKKVIEEIRTFSKLIK